MIHHKTLILSSQIIALAGLLILAPAVVCGEDIHTNILIRPALILHNKYYLTTKTNISALAEITSEKFKNSNVTYQWATKDKTIITSGDASYINYTFDKPDEDTFLKLVVQTIDAKSSGSSKKDLSVRDPIEIADLTGKVFIQHGELLDITMKWSGTGPYKFCYRFCPEQYKDDCDNCTPFIETDDLQVRIERYLRFVGNYTLLFKVDNLASVSRRNYSVRVESTFRYEKVSYVPIISSISAVLILFSGLALHIKFRKIVDMETADFEFLEIAQDEDELLEGDTFCQRILHLLKKPSTYIP